MSETDDEKLIGEYSVRVLKAALTRGIPAEPLCRALILQATAMLIGTIGPEQTVADLRAMADQIELGTTKAAGHG